jgi:hypothetical protein
VRLGTQSRRASAVDRWTISDGPRLLLAENNSCGPAAGSGRAVGAAREGTAPLVVCQPWESSLQIDWLCSVDKSTVKAREVKKKK